MFSDFRSAVMSACIESSIGLPFFFSISLEKKKGEGLLLECHKTNVKVPFSLQFIRD